MKTLKMIFYSALILLSQSYCKNKTEGQNANSSEVEHLEPLQNSNANSATPPNDKNNPLIIATPPGYYEPADKSLRKLSLIEMYNYGTTHQFKNTLPLKDKDGKPIDWKVMQDPEKMMFIQMWANREGQVVEGVVFPLTDSVKAMILKVNKLAE